MSTVQLFALTIPFVVLLGAIVAGAWLNQRALERQMDAFRSEINAVMGAFKAEVKAEISTFRAEVREGNASLREEYALLREENASLRLDSKQTKQTVEKIDRQLEAIVSRLIFPK